MTVTPDQCVIEIMTHKVTCVGENTSLSEAAHILSDQGIRHLIVIDEDERLCGVFSDRDLMKHTVHQMSRHLDPASVPVKAVMVSSPLTVNPLTTITSAAYLLAKNKFGCLPVIADDKTVLGIISVVDVLRYFSVGGKHPYDGNDSEQQHDTENELTQLVNDFELAKEVYESHAKNLTDLVQELDISKSQTEELLKSKSKLLSHISHEIRTPLTAILGYSELLTDAELDQDSASHVETISRNGRYLLEIVNDVLDLTKIDAQKMEIERTEISPASIVKDVLSTLLVKAEEKGISLIAKSHGPIPDFIESDPTRLKQILMNLVGNAVKFTEHGFVLVSIQYPCIEGDPGRIAFEIQDTGIGISRNKIEKLFQPFTQVDDSSARKSIGSGLGLSISQKLAEMLGGSITVESELGEGAIFRLTMEVGDHKKIELIDPPFDHACDLSESHYHHASDYSGDGKPLKVLVGDDNPDVQKLLVFFLDKLNTQVTVVDNGLQVYRLAEAAWHRHEPFDVILLDMEIPILNGYQTTSKLRDIGYTGQIVACVAHHDEEERKNSYSAGCDIVLSKPISSEMLYSSLATPVVCLLE